MLVSAPAWCLNGLVHRLILARKLYIGRQIPMRSMNFTPVYVECLFYYGNCPLWDYYDDWKRIFLVNCETIWLVFQFTDDHKVKMNYVVAFGEKMLHQNFSWAVWVTCVFSRCAFPYTLFEVSSNYGIQDWFYFSNFHDVIQQQVLIPVKLQFQAFSIFPLDKCHFSESGKSLLLTINDFIALKYAFTKNFSVVTTRR